MSLCCVGLCVIVGILIHSCRSESSNCKPFCGLCVLLRERVGMSRCMGGRYYRVYGGRGWCVYNCTVILMPDELYWIWLVGLEGF